MDLRWNQKQLITAVINDSQRAYNAMLKRVGVTIVMEKQ